MNSPKIKIKPFGVHAILIEWPHTVNEQILEIILQYQAILQSNGFADPDWEMVPSYNSLMLVNRKHEIDHNKLTLELENYYTQLGQKDKTSKFLWRLPVCYDQEFGLDLQEVGAKLNISIADIIAMHTGAQYTVFGIGFLPGFMYLGGLNEKLEVNRKASPRAKVEKGAVGIAGKQAGIYPQESPGGWNIIGNCPVPIFDASKENPCFVNVGDKIEFFEISRAAYKLHKIEAEVGIYQPEKIQLNA
ncbi:5-oxoprolinase subunit PxpB [Maribacter sp. MAR_2009_72]|uniref:5-oxoprolinase subunit PxpB n=1 Tax=Maribacter sp. MAR_2009_72 TaxID=1250050 RepID=UPI00119A8B1E|nr:5-oxoprolinase subunit PxpB [Maribacter sp. MAR_2009_72]TVZ14022.1 KipI family sensor histidine kinase inhibitor [Maribacter sp. MAR_2009_72]